MTKKARSGKFGARYGVSIRSRVREIEHKTSAKYICSSCGYKAVKRHSTGVWECRHCGIKFAGAAYTPITITKPEALAEEEERENV